MKTGTSIFLSFVASSCIALAAGSFALVGLSKLQRADTRLYREQVLPMAELLRLSSAFPRIGLALRDLIGSSDPTEREASSSRLARARGDFESALPDFESRLSEDADRLASLELAAAWAAYAPLVGPIAAAAKADRREAAREMLSSAEKGAEAVQSAIDRMASKRTGDARAAALANEALAKSAISLGCGLAALGALAFLGTGLFMARSIRRRVALEEGLLREIKEMLDPEDSPAPSPSPRPAPNAASLPRRGLVLLPPSERKKRPRAERRGRPQLRLIVAGERKAK
jgi:methyl-accepting chemotaxis protein